MNTHCVTTTIERHSMGVWRVGAYIENSGSITQCSILVDDIAKKDKQIMTEVIDNLIVKVKRMAINSKRSWCYA